MSANQSILSQMIERIESTDTQTKLPSENKLAQHFGVSRHTIRKEYELLERMGLIDSHQGVGHFTKDRRPQIDLTLDRDLSFSEKMTAQDIPYRVEKLAAREVTVAELKQHFPGDYQVLGGSAVEVSRLRILYDQPAAIHYMYINQTLFPEVEIEIESYDSIFNYYRIKGYDQPETGSSTLNSKYPNPQEQEALNCKDLVPLFQLNSKVTDKKSGEYLQLSRSVYRSDSFSYIIN